MEINKNCNTIFYKYNIISNSHDIKDFIPDGGINLDAHDKLLVQSN